MDGLIPLINKLQKIFSVSGDNNIDLPQIVVVGCQSAGKSSVLEAIVGRDFLPRGTGICTRCPLVLQLVQDQNAATEIAIFNHRKDTTFTNFYEVRKEIENITNINCGNKKDVKDIPILLEIRSRNFLSLTLVDLPGLTKNVIDGQSPDIVKNIRNMVMRYITNPNSIILAVTPANQDIATSDSLQIAKEVDPNGERTIGVLTKLDIMDKGTNARNILLNKEYPLKLGFIGVVNRSQAEVDKNVSVNTLAEKESKFFKEHPSYSDIANECGTQYLSRTLNRILNFHIKTNISSLYTKINNRLASLQVEMQTYGIPLNENPHEQMLTLFALVSKYVSEYNDILNGTSYNLFINDLDGGASILKILIEDIPQEMLRNTSVKDFDTERITTAMRNISGVEGIGDRLKVIKNMLGEPLKNLCDVALSKVDTVVREMGNIHTRIDMPELKRFINLHQSIQDISNERLMIFKEKVDNFIKDLSGVYLDYLFAEHPDIEKFFKKAVDTAEDCKELAHRYYVIIRKEIIDIVPKTIVKNFIHDYINQLRFDLVERLVLDPKLREDDFITNKRRTCNANIKSLKEALDTLGDIRRYHV